MKKLSKMISKVPPLLLYSLSVCFQKLEKSNKEPLEDSLLERLILGVNNFQGNRIVLIRVVLRKSSMMSFTGVGKNWAHSSD